METVNERMKYLRSQTDVTLKEMANLIGVSEATVQRYESGNITKVPYKAIIEYAKKFNTFPGYIMGWTNNPNQYTVYDQVNDVDFHLGENTIETKPHYNNESILEKYGYYLTNDSVIKNLVDVAITCTEDDVEMAIKLLKYFRIVRG